MFKKIKNIKSSNRDIRSFGITIGLILIIISALLFYYDKTSYQILAIVALGFIGLGITIPISLKPTYLVWITFSIILEWIMTRVILSILFYLVLTPIGLVTRLLGKDFLALRTSDSNSYWNDRDRSLELNQDYEKQF
tara:strand:+ start:3408 stop:3818 length:411 start_codon:yes stop_codon:yes gene_type:complete